MIDIEALKYQKPTPQQRNKMELLNAEIRKVEQVLGLVMAEAHMAQVNHNPVGQESFDKLTEAIVNLAEVANRLCPEGPRFDRAARMLEAFRMEANMVLSGYPHDLQSTATASPAGCMGILAYFGMWCRAAIAIDNRGKE